MEATLSHEGVGGVRNASFTGGLLFIETVDVWEPGQRLAFSIAAQTDKIPATTLDKHFSTKDNYRQSTVKEESNQMENSWIQYNSKPMGTYWSARVHWPLP